MHHQARDHAEGQPHSCNQFEGHSTEACHCDKTHFEAEGQPHFCNQLKEHATKACHYNKTYFEKIWRCTHVLLEGIQALHWWLTKGKCLRVNYEAAGCDAFQLGWRRDQKQKGRANCDKGVEYMMELLTSYNWPADCSERLLPWLLEREPPLAYHLFWTGWDDVHTHLPHSPTHAGFPIQEHTRAQSPSNGPDCDPPYTYHTQHVHISGISTNPAVKKKNGSFLTNKLFTWHLANRHANPGSWI